MSRRGNRHFKKQLNNQGFSLLELLVVIAIIAVVSLLVTVGLTVLNKGNAKKANKNLYSSLSELKTSTMAKNGNWYMEIGKDGDSYVFTTYKDTGSPLETYKCSASRISIVYEAGTSSYNVDDYTIMVKFSKADGSCDSVTATKSEWIRLNLRIQQLQEHLRLHHLVLIMNLSYGIRPEKLRHRTSLLIWSGVMKKDNKGFSLVELLIAIAISSIVLMALVMLITQAVRSYTKQTALAQIQSDADISLNQMSKNILEATEVKIEKLNGDVTIYTNKVIEKKNSTEVGIEWGYYYESATQQLWYINSDKSEMSLVCDNVTSFDVRISKDSIELDTATIKSIDRNPQIVISLGLQRMNEKRIVSRTFSTRNQLNDNITLGKSITSVEGDKDDVVNTLKVGNTLSAAQIIDYFTDN